MGGWLGAWGLCEYHWAVQCMLVHSSGSRAVGMSVKKVCVELNHIAT